MDNRFSNESFDSEMSILQYDCHKLCIIIVQCSILLINLKYSDMNRLTRIFKLNNVNSIIHSLCWFVMFAL